MTPDLFAASEPRWEDFPLPDASLRLWRGWLAVPQAGTLFRELHTGLPWESGHLTLHGKAVAIPRLYVWYGDHNRGYTYSGKLHKARPLPPLLDGLRRNIEQAAGRSFNSVLCNLYRSGQDSVALHSDDEKELGPEPSIASLSLGATRRFLMRHKQLKSARLELELAAGDLLLMAGQSQAAWVHGIPRTTRPVGPRINLTFRWIR